MEAFRSRQKGNHEGGTLKMLARSVFRSKMSCCFCGSGFGILQQCETLLLEQRGTSISTKTLSWLWRNRFPHAATLCKANTVPIDTYKPENSNWYVEYIDGMRIVDPTKLKFGDEKHLKGGELYTTCGRRCTGEIPPVAVSPNLRNTYSIAGFCCRYDCVGVSSFNPPAHQHRLVVIFRRCMRVDCGRLVEARRCACRGQCGNSRGGRKHKFA